MADQAGGPLATARERQRRAGQRAALAALAAAGCHITALPPRAGPVPTWPDGFAGSIAHTSRFAIAAVSQRPQMRGIGVDIEDQGGLQPDDVALVFSAREIASVAATPSLATLIWSAKESCYKAWCGALGAEIGGVDPSTIEIALDPRGAFTTRVGGSLAAIVAPLGPLSGSYISTADLVISLAILGV